MNIKYIVNVRIPTSRAHGYAIMKMCEKFSENGAKLDLVVPNRRNNESEDDPFLYYRVKKIFNIIRLKSSDLLGDSIKFGKLFYWIDLLSFFVSLKFTNLVKKGDVIYTRDFTIAMLFSKKRFICLELHDIPKSKFLFKMAIKKPRLFFVLNENIKKELTDLGIPAKIIHISPSGVEITEFDIDIDKNEARKKIDLPLDKKIIMYTGHLYKWKGVDTVMNVAIKMPENLFIFIGGVDPEFSQYKEKYKQYKNIILLPFVQRNVIPFYLKSADVLVMPYSKEEEVSAKYTSPLKLFEYMASKRPIVSSDLSSIRQTLDDSTCVFAKPGDEPSFSNAISKVLSDESLSEKISSRAFKEVSKYTWQKRAERIIDFINKSN